MKQFIPYIAGAVIAAASFFAGSVTDIGQAIQLAFDKEQAAIECAKLLNVEENE